SLVMVGTEDHLRIVGIEIREALPLGFAEVAVIAGDQILDLGALDERLRRHLLRSRCRNGRQRQAPRKSEHPEPTCAENLHVQSPSKPTGSLGKYYCTGGRQRRVFLSLLVIQ